MRLIGMTDQGTPVCKVRLHPTCSALASVSATLDQYPLWSWDNDGNIIESLTVGSGDEARYLRKDLAFHPRGDTLALAGKLRRTELLRLESGLLTSGVGLSSVEARRLRQEDGHALRLGGPWDEMKHHCVQFSSSGSYLLAGSAMEAKTDAFDVSGKQSIASCWVSHSVTLHPDGEILAAVVNHQGGGGVHFVRMTNTLDCYGLYLEAFPNIGNVVFSPTGNRLALVLCCIALKDGWYLAYQVHDFPSCDLLWKREIVWPVECRPCWLRGYKPTTLPVERAVFSTDDNFLLCPYPNGDIVEFNITKDIESRRWSAHSQLVMSLDVRYGDALLLSGGSDGYIKLWQLDDSYRQLEQPSGEATQAFLTVAREVAPFSNYWELDPTTGQDGREPQVGECSRK